MAGYTEQELTEALRAIDSIIHKCEKAQEKFPEGNSHHTLLRNRLKAMYLSKGLITEALEKVAAPVIADAESMELFLSQLDWLQITELGAERVRKNLSVESADLVGWCRERIRNAGSHIMRKGKNWYILTDGCEITVNAQSCTIITAHRVTGKRREERK